MMKPRPLWGGRRFISIKSHSWHSFETFWAALWPVLWPGRLQNQERRKERRRKTLLTKLPSLVFILPTYFCALHVNLQCPDPTSKIHYPFSFLCHSYSIFSHLDPIPLYGYHVFTTNSHPSSSLKSVKMRLESLLHIYGDILPPCGRDTVTSADLTRVY